MTDVTKTALRNLTTHINPTPNWCTFLWFLCTLQIVQSTEKLCYMADLTKTALRNITTNANQISNWCTKSEKSDEIFALFENRKSRSYKAEIWKLWRDFRSFRKPKITPIQSWNLKICVDFYDIEKRQSRPILNNSYMRIKNRVSAQGCNTRNFETQQTSMQGGGIPFMESMEIQL